MKIGNAQRLIKLAAAMTALAATHPAHAAAGLDLIGPDTFVIAGDMRLTVVNGEQSWIDGGFGKLRFGGSDAGKTSNERVRPALGSADLVWQPKFGWALSATIVGSVQQRNRLEAGLSEAYLSFKPLSDGRIKFRGRAGLMWPPVSLEHSGPEWAVRDTITPSAINSWIGEEVKFVGAEATVSTEIGGSIMSASAAIIDANDTAGALLAFRGWALHDVKTLAWRKHPLPVLSSGIEDDQPRFTHPIKEIDGGFLNRPGWYVHAAWQWRAPIRIEASHYDNGSNPDAVDAFMEWGWRTQFDNVGLTATVAPATELRVQALRGRTKMGFIEGQRRLVEMRFRSAFALITQRFGEAASISARAEVFDTRNRGSEVTSDDNEHGWAATLAGKHSLGRDVTALIELLHVESWRPARERAGLSPRQNQTQLQLSLRLRR